MADYNGTYYDDIIDASELASDVNNIFPGKGNDTVTNATSKHTIIASSGEDSISGEKTGYAFWQSPQGVTINLKEGWSEDGFGTRDTLSGIETIHGSSHGDIFYGTENYEMFFVNGGNNTLSMGMGNDVVAYAPQRGPSTDYQIKKVGDEIHVIGKSTIDVITGTGYIQFMADSKLIEVSYLKKSITSTFIEVVHSFQDSTTTESYTYAGKTYEAGLIIWFPQKVFIFDVNDDGKNDIILPIGKGYAQKGINSATPFVALTVNNDKLIFDEEINATMPIDAAAGRSKPLFLEATNSLSFITSNIYTANEVDRINPDYSITPPSNLRLTQKIGKYINPEEIFPILPEAVENYPLAVDAHSMATGDINGDGLDDVFMGRMKSDGGYELLQQDDGTFVINRQEVYKTLNSWPLTNNQSSHTNLLLDSDLIDVNNDGYDDLIVGFGHGSASSLIFINDEGKFTENNIIKMPDSIYGVDNQMHLLTFPADFDHDGDIDIGILWTRYEPYYGGYYIQFNLNDGNGNFTDVTEFIPEKSTQDAYNGRLTWVEPWQMFDINDDGHLDLAGSRSRDEAFLFTPIVYLNDGEGRFEIKDIGSQTVNLGPPYAWGDFDNDKKIEYITFLSAPTDSSLTIREQSFHLFEFEKVLNTGPEFLNASEQDAPGFNERYYLNENPSVQEAVKAGTYDTGLAHYLAEGKDAGLKTFAPFTKVHGYSGNDTIVLREGNETAYGYAGDDGIEGGAGNDSIDGGAGNDTAIFKDKSSAFTITTNDNGSIKVAHSSPSDGLIDEGSDTLTSIEKIQFSDKTVSSIPLKYSLSDTIDTTKNILKAYATETQSGTQNYNSGDNIIIADGQAKTLRGLDGDDTYFISNLLPENSSITIIDTSGTNTIQIPSNTQVTKSQWAKDTVRLTFEDSRVITVNNADEFSYNLGGNVTNGTAGTDLTFSELALSFGVDDLSVNSVGTIVDLYII
jgi:Ca2+-binding RTX toxin-like protein